MRKIVLVALMFMSAPTFAQNYVEGAHYSKLDTPLATPPDAVEVLEVFSYLCNHCKTFEPYMQAWLTRLPEGVVFNRIPVEFGRAAWGLYARAYVAAAVLGIEEESHVPMMDAIWMERRQMRNMDQLAAFYEQFGVDKDRFMATARSFAVDMRIRKEQQMVREAGVSGTPAILVAGKYRVNAGGANTSFDTMLAVVDFLVQKELAERTALAPVSGETADTPASE